jgi:hypothetical protein
MERRYGGRGSNYFQKQAISLVFLDFLNEHMCRTSKGEIRGLWVFPIEMNFVKVITN